MKHSVLLMLLAALPLMAADSAEAVARIPKADPAQAEVKVKEPVAIGRQKQLFIDRYIVAKTDQVDLTVAAPKRFDGNPVFCPERGVDQGHGMFPDTVLWDKDRKVYRLWYTSLEGNADDQLPAYAESADGVAWKRPVLNIRDFHGSKANNLLDGDSGIVVLDPHDPDATRRYKRVITVEDKGSVGVGMMFSPDGLHWTNSTLNPVLNHTGDTHSMLGWDPQSGKYIGYFRPKGERPGVTVREQKRRIGISFSDDAEHWTPIVPIIESDQHDPPGTEFYWLHAVPYENVYVGLLSVLHMDNALLDFRQPDPIGREQTVDMELVVSRDGIHWLRTNNRQPWLALGRYQSWDDETMWPALPVVTDDEIRVYYAGWNLRHQLPDLSLSYTDFDGRWRPACIGFVSLRRDGWFMARPVPHQIGVLTTRTFTFEGSKLELNANASGGKIIVELLDAAGQPLPGFSSVISADSIHQRVAFAHPLPHAPVRLRFTLDQSELYAFQFVD